MMTWVNNMAIGGKLILITVLTSAFALLLAGAYMAYYNNQRYEDTKIETGMFEARILGAAVSTPMVFDDQKAAQEYMGTLKGKSDIEAAAAYDSNGKLFASYLRLGIAANTIPDKPGATGARFNGAIMELWAAIALQDGAAGTIYLRETAIPLNERVRGYAVIMLVVGLVSLLASLPIAMRLNRGISSPIRDISVAAARIAHGDLDVKISSGGRTDEIGMLLQSFDEMVAGLREMTGEMRKGSLVLAETMTEILTTTTQVAAGSSETATAISQTSVTIEEVRQTVQMSVDKARLVSETAQRTAEVAQNGRDAVEEVGKGMTNISEQMNVVARTILRLSEQGQAIGEIIAAVNDLADQSNLLAVNAAIEAARAGEHGRGFAVVAQEVRNLAEQSKQSTAQIRAILGEIQKATAAAVLATEQGGKAVNAGVDESGRAGESIRLLTESIELAAEAAAQITASCQEQLAGVSQVAISMESIKQASAQNAAGIRQVEQAASNVNELGQTLKLIAKKYSA